MLICYFFILTCTCVLQNFDQNKRQNWLCQLQCTNQEKNTCNFVWKSAFIYNIYHISHQGYFTAKPNIRLQWMKIKCSLNKKWEIMEDNLHTYYIIDMNNDGYGRRQMEYIKVNSHKWNIPLLESVDAQRNLPVWVLSQLDTLPQSNYVLLILPQVNSQKKEFAPKGANSSFGE